MYNIIFHVKPLGEFRSNIHFNYKLLKYYHCLPIVIKIGKNYTIFGRNIINCWKIFQYYNISAKIR